MFVGEGFTGEEASAAAAGSVEGGDAGEGTEAGEVSRSEANLLGAAGAVIEGLGGDVEGDEVEKLMCEVHKARELGAGVTDDERRSRAADVAMRLAALLGGDDDGDSSGGDDSD
ncbi:unnamed protein product [Laminaria digitata]